jgi:hypothetical protein
VYTSKAEHTADSHLSLCNCSLQLLVGVRLIGLAVLRDDEGEEDEEEEEGAHRTIAWSSATCGSTPISCYKSGPSGPIWDDPNTGLSLHTKITIRAREKRESRSG